jgi:hypothetical protein
LASNFGFKTNAAAFERLAQSLPISTLGKISGDSRMVEAALFGQAGFLTPEPTDNYQASLFREYQVLQHRFCLSPLSFSEWKFFRLRPANFPTIRIAQLAALLSKSTDFTGLIIDNSDIKELHCYFSQQVSEYWQTHYQFGKLSKRRFLSLGEDSISNIMINTVCPFLFVYGMQHGDEQLKTRALSWLESLAAEDNNIIRQWRNLGAEIDNARQSQAYLELKNGYCDARRCLECQVGCRLVAEV